MLTTKTIQNEIDDLLAKGDVMRSNNQTDDKDYRAMQRRIKFLKSCLFYLQENPREEFMKEQLEKLRKKLYRIMNGYNEWYKYRQKDDNKSLTQLQSEYNSQMGTSHINNQIKTIEFILA